MTIFEAVGGAETFDRLVERFYAGVATDPILRPMYPDDLAESQRRLALFLMQYFGGPTTYSDERGHPRLRLRHLPFAVTRGARDAWMRHMSAALESLHLPEPEGNEIARYLNDSATFMINQPE